MTQRESLIAKFRIHGNKLETRDFRTDPAFACEYRRLLCEIRKDLAKKGGTMLKTKITATEYRYQIVESDQTGQLRFA
jgi:hypothetical protein